MARKKKPIGKKVLAAAIFKSGGFVTTIAQRLGVSRRHVYNLLKTHDMYEELESEREFLKDVAENALQTLIKEGNTAAIIFYLKTQAKERGYVERSEVAMNARVEHVNLSKIDDQTLITLANEIEKEQLSLKQ